MYTRRSRETLAVAVLVLAAACSPKSASPTPPAAPAGTGPLQESSSTADRLPSAFPPDLPLPEPHHVVYSATNSLGVVAYFTTSASDADVKRFLLERPARADWTLVGCESIEASPRPSTLLTFRHATAVATIAIGYRPDLATRLNGKRYSFFVSVAFAGGQDRPAATPC